MRWCRRIRSNLRYIPDRNVHGKPHRYSKTYGSGNAGIKLWCKLCSIRIKYQ